MNFWTASWCIQSKWALARKSTYQFIKVYLVILQSISSEQVTKSIYWSQLKTLQKQNGWSSIKKKSRTSLIYSNFLSSKKKNKDYNICANRNYRTRKFHYISLWWMQLTRPKSNYWHSDNAKFRLFFTTGASMKSTFILVSINRYVHRLAESLTFMHNLFCVVDRHWMLGNELFSEELLVFNWETQWVTHSLFKRLHASIYYKDFSHGSTTHSIMYTLTKQKLDFIIITDLRAHAKANIYLQKYGVFTIGLIPTNYNPWRVSYPIPAYSNSPKIQLFFIHIIFYTRNLVG